jgi:predicted Rossmann fold flavoprotein
MNPPPAVVEADVLVLGAGAAGLMCALTAGQRGRSVVVLERAERIGKKILVSGGGRCNFTNLHATADNYLSAQPDFCRSALARYTPADFIALVESHGIAYHEKKLGQLFCDGSSREIVALLAAECREAGVRTLTDCAVEAAVVRDAEGGFLVQTARGAHRAAALVVATGGLSWPQLGGSDLAYRLARQFGLRLIAPRPGLVPLTFDGTTRELCAELSGVALPCVARAPGGRAFHENLLFTHRGLSGPAVLQISSYLPPAGETAADVVFDLLPDAAPEENWLADAHRRGEKEALGRVLATRLPARLAQAFARSLGPPRPLGQYSPKALAALERSVRRWSLAPGGTEGYPKAEVTLGGVDTRDLHGRTMEARNVPGLYFVGEAVDVTGQLGGFNFQWAWASGHAAGEAV